MLRTNYQAKIWHDFTSPACPSSPLNHGYFDRKKNHGYAIDEKLFLPVQYTTDACAKCLNQLPIEYKSDVESSDSSDGEYSDYESSDDDDDDNDESDSNDED